LKDDTDLIETNDLINKSIGFYHLNHPFSDVNVDLAFVAGLASRHKE